MFGVLGEGGAVGPARRSVAINSAAARDTDVEPSAFVRRLRTAAASGFAAGNCAWCPATARSGIWNAAAEALPGCVEIVDLRRAREHLREVGLAPFGEGAALCGVWSRKW